MSKFRKSLITFCLTAAILIPTAVFARGGGGGGGARGGGGMGGGGMGGGGMGGGGMGGGGMGGAGMGGGNTRGNQQQQTIAADKKAVSDAQATLSAANSVFTAEVAKFKANYVKLPDYAAAQKAVDEANKELAAARAVVIAKLKASSPEYRAALQKEADAKKKLDAINAAGDRDKVFDQSKVIMAAGAAVSKIEGEALDKDPAYQEAKKKVTAASEALKAQQAAMAEAIKNDTGLAALQSTIDSAKSNLEAAQAKLKADGG